MQPGTGSEAQMMASGISSLIMLVLVVVMIVAMWKVFQKAGKPGWASIVPIYNLIVMLDIAGKPWWWMFLFFIPLVNFVILILVNIALAKAFGRGVGFAIGLMFLGFIFWPILGFGDAQYVGPEGGAAPQTPSVVSPG